ncbi:hypothetical protein [Humisphaera borealis]|uniref:Uncharacterized protein n=1 Tax=Humisphaera borealis TaxID=2807512 RepID=A0A7M2X437_9BACT|nr:hypothetical protein [Humisphaera borealis]QOV92212.1 hypothetical protein IPV69_12990 [Humisphaera borealis]
MVRFAAFSLALLFVVVVALRTANQPAAGKGVPSDLDRKIQGTWRGGPCMGELDLSPDGTFARRYYTPGGNTLGGTWEVRWNAMPPRLFLKCQSSDNPDFEGKTEELIVAGLNDKYLVYAHFGGSGVARYKRVMKSDEDVASAP